MNIWIIPRIKDRPIQHAITIDDSLAMDYITLDTSRFELLSTSDIKYNKGDYIIAKFDSSNQFAYFGVISSKEDNVFVCKSLLSLVDFDIPTARYSSNSFERQAKELIETYLINDPNKLASYIEIEAITDTACNYQPKEPPSTVNLSKYLVNGFKKYNIVWEFIKEENGKIYTAIRRVNKHLQLKNNVDIFYDWSFSNTEVGVGTANHLLIVDKKTTNMMKPIILDEWYITEKRLLTQNRKHEDISRPTKTTTYIYDTEPEDKPTFLAVADEQLNKSSYSHEINCTMVRNNMLFSDEDIQIGNLFTIMYDDDIFESVLAGYEFVNSREVGLRFGHIRSTLSEILE